MVLSKTTPPLVFQRLADKEKGFLWIIRAFVNDSMMMNPRYLKQHFEIVINLLTICGIKFVGNLPTNFKEWRMSLKGHVTEGSGELVTYP